MASDQMRRYSHQKNLKIYCCDGNDSVHVLLNARISLPSTSITCECSVSSSFTSEIRSFSILVHLCQACLYFPLDLFIRQCHLNRNAKCLKFYSLRNPQASNNWYCLAGPYYVLGKNQLSQWRVLANLSRNDLHPSFH